MRKKKIKRANYAICARNSPLHTWFLCNIQRKADCFETGPAAAQKKEPRKAAPFIKSQERFVPAEWEHNREFFW